MKDLFELEIKNWKLDFQSSETFHKLNEILSSEPEKANENTLKIWKDLKPLNLDRLIEEKRLTVFAPEHKNSIKFRQEFLTSDELKADYHGQMNSK